MSGGLYFFELASCHLGLIFTSQKSLNFVPTCMTSIDNNTTLWHARLRHATVTKLHKLHVFSTVKFSDHSIKICSVCPRAKQTRLPFLTSQYRSATPFELIHFDL